MRRGNDTKRSKYYAGRSRTKKNCLRVKQGNEQAIKIINLLIAKRVKICGTTPGKAIFILGKGYIISLSCNIY